MDCIYSIRSELKSTTQKMDCIDWLGRNLEFISLKLFDKFVKVCIELKNDVKHSEAKISLYDSPHSSGVLFSLRRLIVQTQDTSVPIAVKKHLPQYLRLLEIALFNKKNAEKGHDMSLD
jgi:hypothetical protein